MSSDSIKSNCKSITRRIGFWLGLSITIFLFFFSAHPLFIFDTDDWTYITCSRHAVPAISYFNPGKVLPETLMPLVAQLGVSIVFPFMKDYIMSLAFAFAFVLTLFIVFYVFQFSKIVETKMNMSWTSTVFLVVIFVLFHWFVYNQGGERSKYFFYSGNVNCIFNYIIPFLVNSAIALRTIRQDGWAEPTEHSYKAPLIVLFLYLAIFSNLFHSIILVSYAFSRLLIQIKDNKRLRLRGLEIQVDLGIVLLWLIVNFLEMFGGRARQVHDTKAGFPIGQTFKRLMEALLELNIFFIICVIAAIAAGSVCFYKKRKSAEPGSADSFFIKILKNCFLSFIFTIIYLLVVCTVVNPEYIGRSEILCSLLFWFMLAGFISCAYLISNHNVINLVLPLFVYVLLFETVVTRGRYMDVNVAQLDTAYVKQFDDNLIAQVIEADKAGKEEIVIEIPVFIDETWPLNMSYGGDRIATALYRHGITSNRINIKLVPKKT